MHSSFLKVFGYLVLSFALLVPANLVVIQEAEADISIPLPIPDPEVPPLDIPMIAPPGDVDGFLREFCINGPRTNLFQVINQIENLINQLLNILGNLQRVINIELPNPLGCFPGIPNIPQLPGLPDLAQCLDFSALQNIFANIQNCLLGVLNSFPDLDAYFRQFQEQYDLNQIRQCLENQVPDLDDLLNLDPLEILRRAQDIVNQILGLIGSVRADLPKWDGTFNWLFDFCQNRFGQQGGGVYGGGTVSSSSVSGQGVALSFGFPGAGGAAPAAVSAGISEGGAQSASVTLLTSAKPRVTAVLKKRGTKAVKVRLRYVKRIKRYVGNITLPGSGTYNLTYQVKGQASEMLKIPAGLVLVK